MSDNLPDLVIPVRDTPDREPESLRYVLRALAVPHRQIVIVGPGVLASLSLAIPPRARSTR